MQKIKATAAYALVHVALWGGYAVLISFASNYLIGHGFNGNLISLLLGLACAVSIAVQLAAAELVSRCKKLSLYLVLLIAGVLMLAGCVIMLLPSGSSFAAVFGFSLSCVLLQIMPAMVNSLGMDCIARGAPINFSVARGCGSFAFSIISYFAGLLIARHGFPVMPLLAAVVFALFLCAVVIFHLSAERGLPSFCAQQSKSASKGFLRRHKRFALFLVGSTLMYINHNLICNFMLQVMQAKDAGAAEQGTANAIAGMLELPAMFAFVWILKAVRCDRLVKMSCFFFAFKTFFSFLAPTAEWVYAAQVFQLAGFALYAVASVHYAGAVIEGEDTVRAQSYLASTITVGSLAALSIGGVLCEQFGAQVMLLVATASALLGGIIICCTAEKVS